MSDQVEIKKCCCRLCSWFCWVQVHVSQGEVLKVEADPDRPGGGFICERAVLAAVDYHYHPQRLNYPLKRAGKRGEGKWQRISWQQAMDEIAGRLGEIREKHGPEAVACLSGHGLSALMWALFRWCNLFGTPNTFQSTKNCWQPDLAIELAVYGNDTYPNLPRPAVTRCMVVFGANPHASTPQAWRRFLEAKQQGAKLVVIDPRRTRTAEIADLWLQIKPGTDAALAYGMLNVIIEEGLYDKEFVEKWCLGFDEVKALVKDYPPAVVEGITWIPQGKVVEAARLYALNKPAIMSANWGVTHSQLGKGRTLPVNLAKCIMRAITGNLDIRGGEELRGPVDVDYDQNLHWDKLMDHSLRKRDTIGADTFPVMSVRAFKLYRQAWQKVFGRGGYPIDVAMAPNPSPFYLWQGILEGNPYPIRGLIISGLNVLCTRTGTPRVYQALTSQNLEIQVAMDLFMTPHAMLADYVLPAADWLERPYLDPPFYQGSLGEQAVPPKYERRHDYDLWRELGLRLGQQGYWPEGVEGMYDTFLKPLGLPFAELVRRVRWWRDRSFGSARKFQKYEEAGFGTPSGKVELVPSLLQKLGYELLPHYQDLPLGDVFPPGLEETYPLLLISGGRLRTFFHSTLREEARLRMRHPDPLVQIHPDTAKELGIKESDWTYIETPWGKIKHKAEVTANIHPRVVHVEHGWWFPEQQGEAPHLFGLWECNAGVILPDIPELCDYQGGPPMRALPCRVSKVEPQTQPPLREVILQETAIDGTN